MVPYAKSVDYRDQVQNSIHHTSLSAKVFEVLYLPPVACYSALNSGLCIYEIHTHIFPWFSGTECTSWPNSASGATTPLFVKINTDKFHWTQHVKLLAFAAATVVFCFFFKKFERFS